MYQYRAIIHRLRAGMGDRQIAREGLAGRPKVSEIRQYCLKHNWLIPEATLPDDATLSQLFRGHARKRPQPSQSKAAPYRDFIKQDVDQGIQEQVIYERLVEQFQFSGSYNCIQRFVQKVKKSFEEELTVPLEFGIGEAAQVDFGQGPFLYDERVKMRVKTWFFVMTLCWSRHQYVELVTHQDVQTWLRCHQNAFTSFGSVIPKIIIDNAKCAVTRACYYNPQVQRSFEEFAQSYGFIISACAPRDPQKKGRVESGVKYVKNNFVPLRSLTSVQQANQLLKRWVVDKAGQRTHGSTFEKPLIRFEEEKKVLKPLPAGLSAGNCGMATSAVGS